MNLQNFTYNMHPFVAPMGSPMYTLTHQVNNAFYNVHNPQHNVPPPPPAAYQPDYNSPNRVPYHYDPPNQRIEPYQKPSGGTPSPSTAYGQTPQNNGYQNNPSLLGKIQHDNNKVHAQQQPQQNNYPYYENVQTTYFKKKENLPQQQQQQPPPQQQYSKPQVPQQQQPVQQYSTKSLPSPVPTPPSNKRIPPQNPSSTPAPQYTRVEGSSGSKTSVHAIIDYDDDFEDYYDKDETPPNYKYNHVTPIQGPITIKNNSVPVVPLYSYDTIHNGTMLHIPILWTALSVALGYEVKGDFVRGPPCIKKYHQLYCPTAGSSYPINKIERFIDENKALMRRMYGEFSMTTTEYGPPVQDPFSNPATNRNRKRHAHDGAEDIDDILLPEKGGGKSNKRKTRQSSLPSTNKDDSGKVDACESKIDIVTPYWASNSAGKVRAIVNTEHFEQAIHQEVCTKSKTGRCAADCGCEQKYKWHRLLSYDPDNDCKGIFMDWFLFPSCCVCRCNPK